MKEKNMFFTEKQMKKLAASCAKLWKTKIVPYQKQHVFILLKGDLGSGKTTFCRYFIQTLYPNIKRIPSPTFTLMQVYHDIVHIDLYRLLPHQVSELGIEDFYEKTIFLIEWPERIKIVNNFLEISFFDHSDNNARDLYFYGTNLWTPLLKTFNS